LASEPPALTAAGVSLAFGGHQVVDQVSCAFEVGSLTAIVGPNGAGKTSFFNLLSGQAVASAGSICLRGQDITRLPAAARTHLGIGRAFQLTQNFPRLSVRENVRLAVQSRRRQGGDGWTIWSRKRGLIERAEHYLARTGLSQRRDDIAGALSHGDQRKLEVAMLLALEPDIFMFDEPTAGMSVDEMPVLLDLIHEIRRDASKCVILVEHKMDVVRALADRIIVLHQGRLVADGAPDAVIALPVVQEAYLGISRDG
jgi:branched-chain amino acid transport system ATP-binding protein